MAKLRVGDILIEGDRIEIAGRPVSTASARSRLPTNPRGQSIGPLLWLAHLPIPTRVLGAAGGTLAIVGFLVALRGVPWQDPISAVFPGGLLLAIGAGCVAAAVLKEAVRRGSLDLNRIALGAESDAVLARIRRVIKPGAKHQTVEWIERQLQLDEPSVVRALALLRDRGDVVEELDTDAGEFYYRPSPRDPQDLDTRLSAINARRHP